MITVLKKHAKSATIATVILLPTLLLQGCYKDDYLSQRDTLTLGAGDAVATNQATHTVDPWAPHSKNTDIHIDGKRAQLGIERYQKNQSIPPRGLTSNGVSSGGNNGGGAQIKN